MLGSTGYDIHSLFVIEKGFELYNTICESKKGVIPATPDILAGMNPCASLTDNDIPGSYLLAIEALYAKTLTCRIPTVSRSPAGFLMCHGLHLLACSDLGDVDLSKVLPVALFLSITLASLHLENDNLF